MRIFLDDERMPEDVTWVSIPPTGWVVVRTFEAFVNIVRHAIKNRIDIELISFDHDLGFGNGISDHIAKSGMDCAKALVELCMAAGCGLPSFSVHSLNPVGKENIDRYLTNAKIFMESDGS